MTLPIHFTAQQVCVASGISPETLTNWISGAEPIVLLKPKQGDNPGGGRGRPNLYSLNRVLQIAVMAQLVRLGWGPSQAALAAIEFSDMGDGGSGWGKPTQPDPLARRPGSLFARGETWLVARPAKGTEGVFSEVVNVDPAEPWSKIAEIIGDGATVIDLSALVPRVRRHLSLPAVE